MTWDEKKTEKMHIRLTPRLASLVRNCAEDNHRHFQDELAVLIKEGLQGRGYLLNGNKAGNEGIVPLVAAQKELPLSGTGPIAAPRRTMSKKRTA